MSWLVLALGVLLSILAGRQFLGHVQTLIAHSVSGSWLTMPREVGLRRYLSKKYPSSKYMAHEIAGSSKGLPMTKELRTETVQYVGQSLPLATNPLTFRTLRLQDAYRSYLNGQLAWLARDPSVNDEAASRVADAILSVVPLRRDQYSVAINDLALLRQERPSDIDVAYAREVFDMAGLYLSDGVPTFPVETTPRYDRINDYSRMVIPRDELARTPVARVTAEVRTIGGHSSIGMAAVTISPEIMDLEIRRGWISEVLLDGYTNLPEAQRSHFFGQEGSLRLVPERLIVHVWDRADLLPYPTLDLAIFEKARATGVCCDLAYGGKGCASASNQRLQGGFNLHSDYISAGANSAGSC